MIGRHSPTNYLTFTYSAAIKRYILALVFTQLPLPALFTRFYWEVYPSLSVYLIAFTDINLYPIYLIYFRAYRPFFTHNFFYFFLHFARLRHIICTNGTQFIRTAPFAYKGYPFPSPYNNRSAPLLFPKQWTFFTIANLFIKFIIFAI